MVTALRPIDPIVSGMGLHICFELRCPPEVEEAEVATFFAELRERALGLSLEEVSEVVRLDERAISAPSPLRGLAYLSLVDVLHYPARFQRDALHRDSLGLTQEDEFEVVDAITRRYRPVEAPPDLPALCIGFAVAPGRGAEPATFALCRIDGERGRSRWEWQCCCKTQYASSVSDEHLLHCHAGLVALLDAMRDEALPGLEVEVHDETGYWESRDSAALLARVGEMNRLIAGFAGRLTDAMRDAGEESAQLGGTIFEHPEFERLETEGRGEVDGSEE